MSSDEAQENSGVDQGGELVLRLAGSPYLGPFSLPPGTRYRVGQRGDSDVETAVDPERGLRMPEPASPACKGKDFEHHERTVIAERADGTQAFGWWQCPACGNRGNLQALHTRLIGFIPVLGVLKEQMLDRDAVFLIPSDATPGPFGQFYGHPLYRVQGIDRPLIALGPMT